MQLISALTTSLLLAGGAIATDTTMSSSGATPSESGKVALHVVKVSNKNGDLKFTPDVVKANTGDMVQFQFYPKNHSVVQSTFDQPCQPIAMNMPSVKGFFSGFMPVKPTDTMLPSYTVMVKNASMPMWFYCSQGKHCQSGMVGVINPPAKNASRTIDTFRALAAKATANITPTSNQTSSSTAPKGSTGSSTYSGSNYDTGSSTYSGSTYNTGSGSSNSTGSAGTSASGSPVTTAPATFTGAANTLYSSGQSFLGAGFAGVLGLVLAAL